MSDINRTIKIFLDGSNVSNSANKIRADIGSIEQKIASLDKTSAGYDVQVKNLTHSLASKQRALNTYNQKMTDTERVLKNLSGATYNELLAVKSVTQETLKSAVPGSQKYNAALSQHNLITQKALKIQKEMRTEVGCQSSVWGRASGFVNRYIGLIGASIGSITGIILKLRSLYESAAKMDDVYADVQKTTGLTREQVVELNEEFKKLDTRTSREQLNQLAADAGKLGITGSQSILDFVEAGNQIRVALGEDLGQDAIKNIGKMTDIYRSSTKELDQLDLKGQMLAIGSAINALGQSSTANESYLVDFSKRLGGVAAQSGLSIQNVLGFASALDQSGQAVEMSATAFQTFIMKLMENPAKFAKLAGIEIDKFNTLLKTDTNAAIIQVLTALNQKGGFQALIPVFQEMGMDGARATGVLSAMATNIDKVTSAQETSNKAFSDGTSITNEYATKNNNLMATLEKEKKTLNDKLLEVGEQLAPFFEKGASGLNTWVNALGNLLIYTSKNIGLISTLAITLGSYILAVKLYNTHKSIANILTNKGLLLDELTVIWLRTKLAAIKLYNAGILIMNGNLRAAAVQLRAFVLALGINPFVLAGAAIGVLTIALYKLATASDNLITTKEAITEINAKVAKSITEEKSQLELQLSVAKNEKISKDQRLAAIKKLNEISPEYLGNLTLENINTIEATTAIKNYTEALEKNAKMKAISDKLAIMEGEIADYTIKLKYNETRFQKQIVGSDSYRITEGEIFSLKKKIDKLNNEKRLYIDLYNEALVDSADSGKGTGKSADPGKETVNTTVYPVPQEDKTTIRLKQIDLEYAQEKLAIGQTYKDGLILKERYQKQLEWLELDTLNKKLATLGLEKEKRLQIQQEILNAELKMKEEAAKPIKGRLNMPDYANEFLSGKRATKSLKEKTEEDNAFIKELNEKMLSDLAETNQAFSEEQQKKFEEQQVQMDKYKEIANGAANSFGNILGGFIGNAETASADFQYNMLMMALDTLRQIVMMSCVEIWARQLAEKGGIFGAIAAGALVGIVNGLFEGIKSSIKRPSAKNSTGTNTDQPITGERVVAQHAAGKYDVIGASDGRLYRDVPYLGPAQTGIASAPVLVGEQGDELVVSAPDFRALQRHINYPLVVDAIRDVRRQPVRQYAAGKYDPIGSLPTGLDPVTLDDSILSGVLLKIEKTLRSLGKNGVNAYMSQSDFDRSQEQKRKYEDPFTRKKYENKSK